jgi:hypothetical protein
MSDNVCDMDNDGVNDDDSFCDYRNQSTTYWYANKQGYCTGDISVACDRNRVDADCAVAGGSCTEQGFFALQRGEYLADSDSQISTTLPLNIQRVIHPDDTGGRTYSLFTATQTWAPDGDRGTATDYMSGMSITQYPHADSEEPMVDLKGFNIKQEFLGNTKDNGACTGALGCRDVSGRQIGINIEQIFGGDYYDINEVNGIRILPTFGGGASVTMATQGYDAISIDAPSGSDEPVGMIGINIGSLGTYGSSWNDAIRIASQVGGSGNTQGNVRFLGGNKATGHIWLGSDHIWNEGVGNTRFGSPGGTGYPLLKTDTAANTASTNDVLTWDGTDWGPAAPTAGAEANDLETDDPANIESGEVYIGTATGEGVFTVNPSFGGDVVALGGDVTAGDSGASSTLNPVIKFHAWRDADAADGEAGRLNWVNYADAANASIARIRVETAGADNSGKIYFSTASAGSLSTALTMFSDQSATFADDVTVTGDLTVNGTDAPKSGVVNVVEDTLTTVTFNAAFSSAPIVTVSLCSDPDNVLEKIWVENRQAASFQVQFATKTSTTNEDICWMAMLPNDPT